MIYRLLSRGTNLLRQLWTTGISGRTAFYLVFVANVSIWVAPWLADRHAFYAACSAEAGLRLFVPEEEFFKKASFQNINGYNSPQDSNGLSITVIKFLDPSNTVELGRATLVSQYAKDMDKSLFKWLSIRSCNTSGGIRVSTARFQSKIYRNTKNE